MRIKNSLRDREKCSIYMQVWNGGKYAKQIDQLLSTKLLLLNDKRENRERERRVKGK